MANEGKNGRRDGPATEPEPESSDRTEAGAKSRSGDDGHALPAGLSEKAMGSDRTDIRLLELLVCPMTKTRLAYDRDRNELVSKAARLAYPIRNGVPLMTLEAARDLGDDEPT